MVYALSSMVCCKAVKKRQSTQKVWKNTRLASLSYPLHFFSVLPLSKCFTAEESTVEASLFVNYSK